MLDDGSTITLVDRKLMRELGIRGRRVDLRLAGVNKDSAETIKGCEKVNFRIKGTFREEVVFGAVTVENLSQRLASQSVSRGLIDGLGEISARARIEPYYRAQVKILIGQDNLKLLAVSEMDRAAGRSLALSRTLLGWTLHGSVSDEIGRDPMTMSVVSTQGNAPMVGRNETRREKDGKLDELVREYFAIDSLGVNCEIQVKDGYERARELLQRTTRRAGSFWETGLLWRDDTPPDVDSLATARRRLFSLERRLDKDPEYAQLYYTEMQRFIELGYADRVEDARGDSRTWYLPHFGVTNVNKPGKVRLVYDAAAKSKGYSLNDQLLSGPDLLKPLPGILMRHRLWAFATKGDLRDMFLRVRVREEDRSAQRFLWRGRDRDREPDIYEMVSLIFGASSSPCSAIFVKNCNANEFADKYPDAAESVKEDSYMDDHLSSRKTESEAATLVRHVKEINSAAGFAMHGWASNSQAVLKAVVPNDGPSAQREARLCDHGKERVLGLFWETESDELKFNVEFSKIPGPILRGEERPTKRLALSLIMSVFDPLGLLAPFTLKSRIVMREAHRSGIGWDEPLKDREFPGWLAWLERLDEVRRCRIPRCMSPRDDQDAPAELHVFCDASLTAYAAAAYLRFMKGDGTYHISLVMAKSRVAPLKPDLDTVRLELQAALVGTRLRKFVQSELQIEIAGTFMWSDSSIVLCWIRSEPRARLVFFSNRLGEIGEYTLQNEWRWVPSHQNPADDATRFSSEALESDARWFVGPDFLHQPEDQWPVERLLRGNERQHIDELYSRKVFACAGTRILPQGLPFSVEMKLMGWAGLLVVARRVRRAILRWWRRRSPRRDTTVIESGNDLAMIDEMFVYRRIQADCFASEIKALRYGKPIARGSRLIVLNPFLDEAGILRANGRITRIQSGEFNNLPVILDRKHPAVMEILKEYHRKFYHGSSETVLNELRQKYFIFGLRGALRWLSHRCLVCRVQRGRPHTPFMSTLPFGRTAIGQRPFSYCGVDYFGPMTVKIGRRREKRWGALFTCLTTRAVHLELAHSLNTSSAIMALQRLAARRGRPKVVYSDNGKNFRGASKELREAVLTLDGGAMSNHCQRNHMRWVFNPPDAASWGGAWERLVQSVKVSLKIVLKDQAPGEEVLLTLLAEVEHSVNSRPLTHVSVDPRDQEALTPNHFLIGTSSGEIQLGRYDPRSMNLRRQYRIAQGFADAYWKRWLREYLPSLIPRKKWAERQPAIEVGDVVLILDLQTPRNQWRKGVVDRVKPSNDGIVRRAFVKTPYGIFERPTSKLIKLLSVEEVQN